MTLARGAPQTLARFRAGSAPRRAAAAWLVLLCVTLAHAAPPGPGAPAAPAAEPKKNTLVPGEKCASVVIRNCRARLVPDPSLPAEDTRPPGRANDAPGRWEAVRGADPDSDDIVVEEDRLRDPTIQEVFERYLGLPGTGYRTRNIAGGARCTTINSTGATLCTQPANQAPPSSLPHTDFSDGAF
jgi:hypothetical protein